MSWRRVVEDADPYGWSVGVTPSVAVGGVRIRGRRIEVDAPYVYVVALGLNAVRIVTAGLPS